jgi:hypothetical protein
MPSQHREHQGFDPATTREAMRRMRGDARGDDRGDLPSPSHPEDQGHRRYRMHVLSRHGQDAPPVGAASRQHHSGVQAQLIAGLASRATIVWSHLTP